LEPVRSLSDVLVPMCTTCFDADRARYGGQFSYNYSPFRPLKAVAAAG
jgi:hypothetical protein